MMTRRRVLGGLTISLVLAKVLVCVGSVPARAETGAGGAPLVPLAIATAAGDVTFQVEIAATPETRRRGLMFRDSLETDRGMLFLFDRPTEIVMWMKDTFIALDMLFIAGDGEIVRIAAHTEPRSTAAIPAGQPVRGVLEINAGLAQRFGIREGDRVRHSAFATAEPD